MGKMQQNKKSTKSQTKRKEMTDPQMPLGKAKSFLLLLLPRTEIHKENRNKSKREIHKEN